LIKRWLEDCCVFSKTFESTTEVLYRSFRSCSERQGERFPPSLTTFAVKLALVDDHGITKFRNTRTRGFRGLALRESQSDMPL
jgi:phage/plasmid-associated DNA primase